MNEPFRPAAPVTRFSTYEEAVTNHDAALRPRGLRLYALGQDRGGYLGQDIEAGMVSINHHGLALPEVPFWRHEGFGLWFGRGWRPSRAISAPSS